MNGFCGRGGAIALAVLLCGLACDSGEPEATQAPATPTDENLRVALIGDQGLGPDAVAVLELIKSEGADLVIHLGDFDYEDDPKAWDDQINSVLGADFPYFALVGNHDIKKWADGYLPLIEERLGRIEGAECVGEEAGVKMHCRYRGLSFVLSGVGTWGFYDHTSYLQEVFEGDDSIWQFCCWHKNRTDFQAGDKEDEVSLEAYQACADRGAVVATGHEHSYARTHILSDIDNPAAGYDVVGPPDDLVTKPGQTFVLVSGIAGKSLRDYDAALHDDDSWWATIYAGGHHLYNGEVTTDYQYTYGAAFIDLHVDADPRKARGYAKNIAGEVFDDFELRAE